MNIIELLFFRLYININSIKVTVNTLLFFRSFEYIKTMREAQSLIKLCGVLHLYSLYSLTPSTWTSTTQELYAKDRSGWLAQEQIHRFRTSSRQLKWSQNSSFFIYPLNTIPPQRSGSFSIDVDSST